MKGFLDTNVVMAGFLTEGLCHAILSSAIAGVFEAAVSEQVLDELTEHLRNEFEVPAADVREVVRHVRRACRVVATPATAAKLCRDPDDDTILADADECGADFLVTGDKDLLVLNPHRRLQIVSPSAFARMIPPTP